MAVAEERVLALDEEVVVHAGVSWEGHLSGALAGVWVAWVMHGR